MARWLVDAKHPRAGKSRLRFRDGTDEAAVVAQLRELAEFFGVTDQAIAEAHAETLARWIGMDLIVVPGAKIMRL